MRRSQCASLPIAVLFMASHTLASVEATAFEGRPLTAPTAPPPGRDFAPPRIDYAGSLHQGGGLAISLDHTYETTRDLSTFWWVKGRGENYRLSLAASYQYDGLQVHAEIPIQYTRLAIDSLMQVPPTAPDRNKEVGSLGDFITSGSYQWALAIGATRTRGGIGLRVRWPTHTTRYEFGLMDGSVLEFTFPHYLHLAPGVLLSATRGSFSVFIHQGMLAMLAKDINIGGILQRVPDIYFWESHLAAGFELSDFMTLSLELVSFVQLNHVDVDQMTNLNHIKAVFVNPGVTFAHERYRFVLAARMGVGGRSCRDFGVMTFSGTHAFLARLVYVF